MRPTGFYRHPLTVRVRSVWAGPEQHRSKVLAALLLLGFFGGEALWRWLTASFVSDQVAPAHRNHSRSYHPSYSDTTRWQEPPCEEMQHSRSFLRPSVQRRGLLHTRRFTPFLFLQRYLQTLRSSSAKTPFLSLLYNGEASLEARREHTANTTIY